MMYLEESDIWTFPETNDLYNKSDLIIINNISAGVVNEIPKLNVDYIFVLKGGNEFVRKSVEYGIHHIMNEELNYDAEEGLAWLQDQKRNVLNQARIEDVHGNKVTEFTGNEVVYITRHSSGDLDKMLESINYPNKLDDMRTKLYNDAVKNIVNESDVVVHQPQIIEDISQEQKLETLITEQDKMFGSSPLSFTRGEFITDDIEKEVFSDIDAIFGDNYRKGLIAFVTKYNVLTTRLGGIPVNDMGELEFDISYRLDLDISLLTKDLKIVKASKSLFVQLPDTISESKEEFDREVLKIKDNLNKIFSNTKLQTVDLDVVKTSEIENKLGKELLVTFSNLDANKIKKLLSNVMVKPKNQKTIMEVIIPKVNYIIANDKERAIDITNRLKKSTIDFSKSGFNQKQNIKGIDVYKVTKDGSTFYLSLFFGYEVTENNEIKNIYDYYSVQNKETTNLQRIAFTLATLSNLKDKQEFANAILSVLNRTRKVIVVK